jgi:hypothetical protein
LADFQTSPFISCGWYASDELEPSPMVYPSGAARITAPVPMVAEAPGLFSTMTLTLSCFSSSSAYLRLIGSVEPPGA